MPTIAPRRRPTSRSRRGVVLAELVVAATLLTVGVLGATTVLATATRDARRARIRHAATALLTARIERWRTTPCSPATGQELTGALLERWRITTLTYPAGALGVLADTVILDARGAERAGVVAVAWCTP